MADYNCMSFITNDRQIYCVSQRWCFQNKNIPPTYANSINVIRENITFKFTPNTLDMKNYYFLIEQE